MTRSRALGLLVALSILAATPVASAPARFDSPTAQSACKRAIILGQRKCIARGQYCTHTRAANRDYHRYGYHCGSRDSRGSFHLVSY